MYFVAWTKKAIRNEHINTTSVVSPTRIFLVDGTEGSKSDKEGYVWGWKCDITPQGLRGVGTSCLSSTDISEQKLTKTVRVAYKNGSQPTADIKMDSYRRKLSLEDVRRILMEVK